MELVARQKHIQRRLSAVANRQLWSGFQPLLLIRDLLSGPSEGGAGGLADQEAASVFLRVITNTQEVVE